MANAVNKSQSDDVIEIDLQEIFGLLLHWLWLLIGCGVVTAAAGFIISFLLITPRYESTTRVYILRSEGSRDLTYTDTQLANTLTKDYEELITSRTVLEGVIERLGIEETVEELKKRITVNNKTDTRIIDITVKDEGPAMAQRLANEIRDYASSRIESVMSIEAVNVVDEANLPTEPSEPSVTLWTAVGFLIGFILCAAVVIVRFLLDDTIKSSEDIERYLGLSTLGLIPDAEMEEKKKKGAKRRAPAREPSARAVNDNGSLEEIEEE